MSTNKTVLDKVSIRYRKDVLEIINHTRRGHIVSAFSPMEIIRVLYDEIMKYDSKKPLWPKRDRFILSKGHGCLALYAVLARKGFFPMDMLKSVCGFKAVLGGHPEYMKAPGIEASTGSLGHGLSLGVGIAINARLDNLDYRTFVLISDGECDEGSIWEAAMAASKHRLDNLTVLIDYNKMQCYGDICEVMEIEPLAKKWESFGFAVKECDGHDVEQLTTLLSSVSFQPDKPSVIICHTIKGKGIDYIEHNPGWHHKSNISDDEMDKLFKVLEANS